MRPKLANSIFNREHNLLPPTDGMESPVYIVDNPSRDFFFPVTVEDLKKFLSKLPPELARYLTHIWLKKRSKKDADKKEAYQGAFICGGDVQLIVLHPFPKDLIMRFGKKKPGKSILKWYSAYPVELLQEDNEWLLKWTKEGIRKYYLEGLLLHEIGHKVDSYYQRYWSSSYGIKAEKFADNFAYYWGNELRTAYE